MIAIQYQEQDEAQTITNIDDDADMAHSTCVQPCSRQHMTTSGIYTANYNDYDVETPRRRLNMTRTNVSDSAVSVSGGRSLASATTVSSQAPPELHHITVNPIVGRIYCAPAAEILIAKRGGWNIEDAAATSATSASSAERASA